MTVANASGNVGISLRTTTTGFASIYFSDATSGGAEASGAVQYKHDDNYMRFTTAESERMRIDSSGNVMVATTAQVNSSLLSLSGTGGGVGITYSGAPTYYFRQLYQSSSGNFFFYNGNNQSYIDQSGSFNDASDERIKKDIEDIDYGLDIVKALKPRKYKMKLDDTEQVGFIAQEVESLVPEVVDTGETPDGEEQKGMSYGHLTAVLTKAIQELSAKVEELESKINE